MSIIIALASIGVILLTLPLILGVLGLVVRFALSVGAFLLGVGLLIGAAYFAFEFVSENPELIITFLLAIVGLATFSAFIQFVGKRVKPRSKNTSQVVS